MPIEPIEPRRLYRQVAQQLRALIEAGEFASGGRLPSERELSAQLGVSRPTVREALIALEVDGWVRIRVGSGIYVVTSPHPSSHRGVGRELPSDAPQNGSAGPFEILEARVLFEGVVAAEAAARASREQIARLDAILADMAGADHPGKESAVLDRAFHVAIADMLGNDAITKTVAELFDQRATPLFVHLASYFENNAGWQDAIGEHRAIRDGIASGDGNRARTTMRRHLQRSMERFSESFGSAFTAEPQRPTSDSHGDNAMAAVGGDSVKLKAGRRRDP